MTESNGLDLSKSTVCEEKYVKMTKKKKHYVRTTQSKPLTSTV